MRRKNIANPPPNDRRCIHHSKDGSRCRQWAIKNHPFCPGHNPDRVNKAKNRPTGHKNAYQHGAYATSSKVLTHLPEVIDELFIVQAQLFQAIQEKAPEIDIRVLGRLSQVMTGNALRIVRVIKDQQAMERAKNENDFTSILNEALDELSEELGIEL
jgi:hypothetical protein